MAVSITHTFVHTVPDEADTSEVRPSDWNAEHTVSGLGTAAEQNLAAFAQTANNLSDLAAVATARTNLGLGTAAVVNIGTSGATIPLLDGVNTWSAQNTFAAGTITTSKPATWTQTWNAAGVTFTGLFANITDTASAAASLLMDLQVGAATKFRVTKAGNVIADQGYSVLKGVAFGWDFTGYVTGQALGLGTLYSSADVFLARDAANTLAQRNGTNVQALRVYKSYTDATNYTRTTLYGDYLSAGGALIVEGLGAGNAGNLIIGTDTPNSALRFRSAGTLRWDLTSAGHLITAADNTYDIGASGATRPRTGYFSGGLTVASPTVGLGYATGAGGTVTQATSRSTGVTLSKVTGKITTTADSIAALGIVTFTVTNTAVAVTDTIILSKVSGDVDASCWVSAVAAGSFDISLRNNDAVSADVTAFVVNFAVIKGVTS